MITTYHLLKTSYQIVIKMKRQQTVFELKTPHILVYRLVGIFRSFQLKSV